MAGVAALIPGGRESDVDGHIACSWPVSMDTPSSPPPNPSGTHRRLGRVLVVDDEPRSAWVLAKLLADDHRVDVASSAKDALGRLLWGERYDVILCNVSMPEMGGLDFHEEVARRLPAQARRIVFLTGGTTDPATRARLDAVGCVVLEKPIDMVCLRRLVDGHIRSTPPPSAATG